MLERTEAINQTKIDGFNIIKNDLQNKERNLEERPDEKTIKRSELEDLLDRGNEKLLDKRLEFKIHEKSNRIIVKLIDKKTDKVIKEIPTEEFLDLVGRIEEFMGVFVDERV